jgi:hypothetical protein
MGEIIATSYSKAGVDIAEENKTIVIILDNLQQTFKNREGKIKYKMQDG